MRDKNFTNETNIIISPLRSSESVVSASSLPNAVVLLIIPAGDRSFANRILKDLPADPAVTYLIFEYGLQLNVGAPVQDIVIEPGKVYWVTPATSLELVKGWLLFRPIASPQTIEKTVGLLLSTVAAAAPGRHVVVLAHPPALDSMTVGLRVVRAEGGYSLLVTEEGTYLYRRPGEFTADLILPAREAADRLRGLLEHFRKDHFFSLDDREKGELNRIYLLLQQEKDVDFSRFSEGEVLRRIRRRMAIYGTPSLKSYNAVLRDDFEELSLLNEELQTCITTFLMEPAIEMALTDDVLPALLARPDKRTLRIWMPRCSDGKQAYSLAIFLFEYLHERKLAKTLQIFATDLNKAAIKRARTGIFEEDHVQSLPARKREKYFDRRKDGYHVNHALRDICVFATQNLIIDPPFANVDLIIGQWLLAGGNRDTKNRIFRSFHYALTPAGFFLPGRIRSRDYPQELFTLVNDNPSILIRKDVLTTYEPLFPFSIRRTEQEADRLLLAEYVPAAMLIDEDFRVLRFYGNTRPFLKLPADRINLHLLKLVKDELIFELGELIEQSDRETRVVKKDGIWLGTGEPARKLSIEVAPLHSGVRRWRLIVFRETSAPPGKLRAAGRTPTSKDLRIFALEREIDEMRRLLLAANEDASTVQVMLQQANEEIMASNEELQSINEQLQSSNDDLLSSNVELNTLNVDLSVKNQQLGSSADYARAVVGSLRRPVVVLHENLSIQTANPAFYYFFSLDPAKTLGQNLWTVGNCILDHKELRAAFDLIRFESVGAIDIEVGIEVSPERPRILAISISQMQEGEGVRAGWVLAAEDITERKMTERFKDEFIGIASHELKTPATTIQAYSQLLYQELSQAENQQPAELARKLSGQVARLTRLTKDLLDVTRLNQGQVNFRKEAVDMDDLVKETVEGLQLTTQLRLTILEHPPIPPVMGDRQRIGQAMTNILTNAIKYAPESKEILIRLAINLDRLTVSVQDFGTGMSPETLRRVFDPFYRSEDPFVRRHHGVGLGLYIGLEIIRRHGGEITVTSEKDKGSTFIIHLPID